VACWWKAAVWPPIKDSRSANFARDCRALPPPAFLVRQVVAVAQSCQVIQSTGWPMFSNRGHHSRIADRQAPRVPGSRCTKSASVRSGRSSKETHCSD
jgi:hypothetical protein